MSLTSLKLMTEELNQALGCTMQRVILKKSDYFKAGKRQDKATKLKAARITKQQAELLSDGPSLLMTAV